MPSPIAHISVGYVIYCCLRSKWTAKTRVNPEVKPSPPWRGAARRGGFLLFTCIFLSLLPDMDCIPGLFTGNLKPFHNYYSHSIFVLLLAAVPLAFLVQFLLFRSSNSPIDQSPHERERYVYAYALTAACVLIHVTMDVLGYGRGQMLFWPLTDARFKLPFYIFYGLRWSEGWWSIHHVWTILTEGLFAVGIIVLTKFALNKAGKKAESLG